MSGSEEALRFARQLIAFPHSDGNLTAASIIQVLVAERDAARQQLADAPHGDHCALYRLEPACDCWKAGL